MLVIKEPVEFDWDEGNKDKNWEKHEVSDEECEEVFFDQNKKILKDVLHSDEEERYVLLGRTKADRLLFVVFTLRGGKLRIISARDINEKEVYLYEEET